MNFFCVPFCELIPTKWIKRWRRHHHVSILSYFCEKIYSVYSYLYLSSICKGTYHNSHIPNYTFIYIATAKRHISAVTNAAAVVVSRIIILSFLYKTPLCENKKHEKGENYLKFDKKKKFTPPTSTPLKLAGTVYQNI